MGTTVVLKLRACKLYRKKLSSHAFEPERFRTICVYTLPNQNGAGTVWVHTLSNQTVRNNLRFHSMDPERCRNNPSSHTRKQTCSATVSVQWKGNAYCSDLSWRLKCSRTVCGFGIRKINSEYFAYWPLCSSPDTDTQTDDLLRFGVEYSFHFSVFRWLTLCSMMMLNSSLSRIWFLIMCQINENIAHHNWWFIIPLFTTTTIDTNISLQVVNFAGTSPNCSEEKRLSSAQTLLWIFVACLGLAGSD